LYVASFSILIEEEAVQTIGKLKTNINETLSTLLVMEVFVCISHYPMYHFSRFRPGRG
jgi:hypothetical protein